MPSGEKPGTATRLYDSAIAVTLSAMGFVLMISGFYWDIVHRNWQYADHDLILAILFLLISREARHAKR